MHKWFSKIFIFLWKSGCYSPQGYSSLLAFSINKTIGLLWEVSPSHPLGLRSLFLLGVVCASCLREDRREVRDLSNLPKSGMMFGWFLHLVTLNLHQYICLFGLNLLLSWAVMFSIFMIFVGIFGPIFDFTIWGVFPQFLTWIWVVGQASSSTSYLRLNPWL
jgi:hypothetical protein